MKHTHKFHRIAALAVAVILAGSTVTANAAVLTDSDTYGPTAVGSAAGWAGASLAKFDPSLGTLTIVTLSLDSDTYAGVIGWDNEAGAASNVTLGIGAEVTITALSTLVVTTVPLQTGSSTVSADNDGVPDYASSDAFWVMGGLGSDSDSTSSTDAGVLTLFTGAGETFDVWLITSLSTLVSTTDGWGPSTTTAGQTDGTITVTYEYTEYTPIPVPEPATVALLGLSSIVLRRRLRL